jgi:hypothetical protein
VCVFHQADWSVVRYELGTKTCFKPVTKIIIEVGKIFVYHVLFFAIIIILQ